MALETKAGVRPLEIKEIEDLEDPRERKICVPVCYANKGDRIVWDTGGRTISIWFPEEGVFPSPAVVYRQKGDKYNKIEMTVPWTAREGSFEYCIYSHDDHEFIQCCSHPKLIIPVPN